MKVVVAMSGGIDSSVAAALLKQEGYQVVGLTMLIQPSAKMTEGSGSPAGYCGIDAVADAKRLACRLGIDHQVVNLRDVFAQKVIADFCREYSRGRTPNPCIRCNRYIKFDALLQQAKELGAEFVATGHYAKIERGDADRRHLLKKGVDSSKDQSYFLYALTQEQLGHSLFPLGNLTKEKVRQIAQELELPVADKRESQEVCFISGDDYPAFVRRHIPDTVKPGPILDRQGNVLGEHRGIIYCTVGQRKGLGLSARKPLYVVAIDGDRNAVIVAGKEEVYGTELTASELNWIATEPLQQPVGVNARIRYQHREADSVVTPLDENKVRVRFKEPQMAITPGQAVVFYDSDVVVGGGIIEQVREEGGL